MDSQITTEMYADYNFSNHGWLFENKFMTDWLDNGCDLFSYNVLMWFMDSTYSNYSPVDVEELLVVAPDYSSSSETYKVSLDYW